MSTLVTAAEIRRAWRSGEEIALLDAREEGPYAEAHPLWAVCLPPGRIPLKVRALVPRLETPVAVYDDGEGRAKPPPGSSRISATATSAF